MLREEQVLPRIRSLQLTTQQVVGQVASALGLPEDSDIGEVFWVAYQKYHQNHSNEGRGFSDQHAAKFRTAGPGPEQLPHFILQTWRRISGD